MFTGGGVRFHTGFDKRKRFAEKVRTAAGCAKLLCCGIMEIRDT